MQPRCIGVACTLAFALLLSATSSEAGRPFGQDHYAVYVLIASDRHEVLTCRSSAAHLTAGNTEFKMQRAIICPIAPATHFVAFNRHSPSAFNRAVSSTVSNRPVILELPLEICPNKVSQQDKAFTERLFRRIHRQNGLVVAAVGNKGSRNCDPPTNERFPADLQGVISVGAGSREKPSGYTLTWPGHPTDYEFITHETQSHFGTSLAAALFVVRKIKEAR